MYFSFVSIFLLVISCNVVQNANILAVMPTPFYSHQATFRPLFKALAGKGHNVTLITTNPMTPHENIIQIDLSGSYSILDKLKSDGVSFGNLNLWQKIQKLFLLADEILRFQLGHPDVQRVTDPTKYHYDVILVEALVPCYLALAEKLDCPLVGLTSMDAIPFLHNSLGNAVHPAIYSYVDYGFGDQLSFCERLTNTFFTVLPYLLSPIISPIFDVYVEEYIGKNLPRTLDLYSKFSLMIVNANPIFHPVRPSTPITINAGGGLHFGDPLPLPQDLQTYLDESKHGCIYFSFGTTVDSNYLSPETLEIFRKTFEELAPIRVLWKFANDTMAFKPTNVELRKWLPQHDILRHPNVKMFITQGGLQSMEEAIDTAVPMLGIPFFGDQINNVKRMVKKEFGLSLDAKTIDGNSLKNSILELIRNPKYKKTIVRLSAISKDEPMNGLRKAVWWTEYLIRHGTTQHLRSPSADIPLYQYFFLDIIAFLLVVFLFTLLVFYCSFKLIRRVILAIFSKKTKQKIS